MLLAWAMPASRVGLLREVERAMLEGRGGGRGRGWGVGGSSAEGRGVVVKGRWRHLVRGIWSVALARW